MLSKAEKDYLIGLIEKGEQIPEDFRYRLFPVKHEEYELAYAGKMRKEDLLANDDGSFPVPLQTEQIFRSAREDEWRNLIVSGDNLQFLKTIYKDEDPLIRGKVKGKVKLIYIDPPFATTDEFQNKEGAKAYNDKKKGAEFVEFLRRRLLLARELLSPDGSIYVHLDQKMSHYIKVLMDEIFGKNHFRNEIAWCYTGPSQAGNYFPRKHDTILFYSRTADNAFYPPRISHKSGVHNTGQLFGASAEGEGKKEEMERQGKKVEDWWVDIWSCDRYRSELAGYPTQKPEELLKRIIQASTREGDLVMDFFAGSGTTAVVAEKLSRRWILCDGGKLSYYICQKRILKIGESRNLLSQAKNLPKYKKGPRPFMTCTLGNYDLKMALDLEFGKYKEFVSGLFDIDLGEYKIGGYVFDGQKDGNPVIIFDYQRFPDADVDEAFLESVSRHAGRRMAGGRIYIVAPKNRFDFMTSYEDLDGVRYYFLDIPYRVIRELHREEFHRFRQPRSKTQINEMEEVVGFSFQRHAEVESSVEVTGETILLTVSDFRSKEPRSEKTAEEKQMSGFDCLAAIFVDTNYSGEEFVLSDFFFADDLKVTDGKILLQLKKPQEAKEMLVIYTDIFGNDAKGRFAL